MITNFLKYMSNLQNKRFLWLLMAILSITLVIIAHLFFQKFLYMKPCEKCVYIRFSFIMMAIAGLIVIINPKALFLKIIGFALAFYGAVKGLICAYDLNKIYMAIKNPHNLFGFKGCSLEAHYPFGIKLDTLFPDIFKSTGTCGIDYPTPPLGADLSSMQEFFIDLYKNGWYLIPKYEFLTMPQCSMIAFFIALIFLNLMLIGFIYGRILIK